MTPCAEFPFRWLCIALAAIGLAACGGGVSNPDSFVSKALLGTSDPPPPIDLTKLGPTTKCPPVTIQPGTESFSVYADDVVGAFSVRHQATIVDTATECNLAGGLLSIKIGVRGRILAGPKSTYGDVSLPLRIAVTRDAEVLVYSEIHVIPTSLSETETSKPWAKVFENIQVPDEGTLRILLGFDDQNDQPPS